jgi:uncharacterized membrane protein YidH (DUF202 family)
VVTTGVGRAEDQFPAGLPAERTVQAWERTAVAMVVAGVLLARYAAEDGVWPVAVVGLAQCVAGGAVLVWAGLRYQRDALVGDAAPPRRSHRALRTLGLGTVAFLAVAFGLVVSLAVSGR